MPTLSKESPRRLDPAKVVDSALLIADTEGLDAVTLRRLAQVHEVTPMALYRHFSDKSDLLAALADRLLADITLPEPSAQPWDRRLRDILTAFVAALRPHPNVAGLTLPRILVTESGLELAERTLGLLVEGGFSPDHAAEVGRQSICSLVSLVTTEPGAGEDPEPAVREQSLRRKRANLGALDPKRYPLVTSTAHVLVCPTSTDDYYTLGIDLVVAGITGVLARQDA
ncbi:transcriptional regulator, TetR family [Kribbella flavida DSM 17836]|uniref:Transcriptional regulator, TetR family n=1 Tax=Kribbella flavida (strain DSM 17836 / JCM 10339 / NBRC 14399) TaxID=479435 RepID=D2PXA9_KRIFD|nr:TetR/AcrR family transcriptional regulator C-terminal domain-containing protein [Kribbella flavida]ADB29757.1 transcriptional regulator, TetR family [Kribbella flavida DSM 17836]